MKLTNLGFFAVIQASQKYPRICELLSVHVSSRSMKGVGSATKDCSEDIACTCGFAGLALYFSRNTIFPPHTTDTIRHLTLITEGYYDEAKANRYRKQYRRVQEL